LKLLLLSYDCLNKLYSVSGTTIAGHPLIYITVWISKLSLLNLLFIIYYLLFIIYYLLFIIYYLLFLSLYCMIYLLIITIQAVIIIRINKNYFSSWFSFFWFNWWWNLWWIIYFSKFFMKFWIYGIITYFFSKHLIISKKIILIQLFIKWFS